MAPPARTTASKGRQLNITPREQSHACSESGGRPTDGAGQRAPEDSGAEGWQCTGHVRLGPVPEKSQAQGHQGTAQKCPAPRNPGCQHPPHGESEKRCEDPVRVDRVAQPAPRQRQYGRMSGRIHRIVGGGEVDVERLQGVPFWRRRVGEPALEKRLCRKQVAELIVEAGPATRLVPLHREVCHAQYEGEAREAKGRARLHAPPKSRQGAQPAGSPPKRQEQQQSHHDLEHLDWL